MKLNLSDMETNAVKHALEKYRQSLEAGETDKATEHELHAVKSVIERMDTVSHAPGM